MEEPGREQEGLEGTISLTFERRLGSGSFGTVYAAFDAERQCKVAVKHLHHTTPEALYLFKREFRALADLVHPNLVMLYDLTSQGDRWFFTMELVEGQSFFEYVRTHPELGVYPSGSHSNLSEAETRARTNQMELATLDSDQLPPDSDSSGDSEPGTPLPPAKDSPTDAPDIPRLRSALRQLAEGLNALHAAGKLHRDLKPGNIMVDGDGRVVILDFGLVMDLAPDEAGDPKSRLFGTPAYMAPEQGSGGLVSEASDWYAVGVVLYEALTGRPPFTGRGADLIRRKLMEEPLRADLLVPNLPRDLVQLCMDLLRRNPFWRPKGAEVLARLGTASAPNPEPAPSIQRGRERELEVLLEHYQALQDGRPRTLALHGGSGMGKSHLLRRFLREVRRRNPAAVILRGRCYEQESVPFKALDSLVDALSNHLAHLPDAEVRALRPANPQALARLFPVLRQVPALDEGDAGAVPDLFELRRQAFGALRELLTNMGSQHPLILVIDDLQWGDLDSALLMEEILRPPDAPVLLLVFAFRSEEKDSSPILREILPKLTASTLELGPLTPEEAWDLSLACLGAQDRAARAQAHEIVQEARGNPFFIRQLALFTQHRELASATGGVEQIVLEGVMALPEEARRLLEVISVAGQPMEVSLARRAARIQGEGPLVLLRARHLIRNLGSPGGRQLEPYHDRIREAVLGSLGAIQLQAHHWALAHVLESSGWQDPETLTRHFEGADEPAKAAIYAAQAGDRASGALAFERAARYYQKALELGAPAPQALWVKLAESLAHAGFGHRAGKAYLEAAAGAAPEEAMRLRRLAADRFIRSGHFEEGVPLLRELVRAAGLSWPATRLQALASLLFHRAQLKLRGLRFQAREADQIPPRDLLRMEVCRVAAGGLSTVDPMRGIDFQTRHLLMALQTGEPLNLARSLALETALRSVKGAAGAAVTARFQALTLAHAEGMGHPEALARAYIAAGIAASSEGRWNEVVPWMDKALATYERAPQSLVHEIHFAHAYGLGARLTMGRYAEVRPKLPALMQAAQERGDTYIRMHLTAAIGAKLHLADDDPGQARAELEEVLSVWTHPTGAFTMPEFYALMTSVDADLYEGQAEGARARLLRHLGPIKASGLLGVSGLRFQWQYLHALVALSGGAAQLPLAQRSLKALQREKFPYTGALLSQLRGGIALLEGRPEEALYHLRAAIPALEGCHLVPQAMAARWALGQATPGAEGAAALDEALAWAREQGIRRPDRFFAMFMPGDWGGGAAEPPG